LQRQLSKIRVDPSQPCAGWHAVSGKGQSPPQVGNGPSEQGVVPTAWQKHPPGDTSPHTNAQKKPAGHTPSPHVGIDPPLHGVAGSVVVVVDVETVVDVVVVVDGATQPLAVHASQQLAKTPTHADPPGGGWHCAAVRRTWHFVVPFALVRQQVTAPGRPHVDFDTHRSTLLAHIAGSMPPSTRWRTMGRAQLRNVGRSAAAAQGQPASTAARAAATAAGSSQAACATRVARSAIVASNERRSAIGGPPLG
jgi:hypothetical protein